MAQVVKSPPAMQETWVQSLGWEDPLEKELATHSGTLAWRMLDRGAWHSTVHVGCIPYLYDLCLPGGSDGKESSYNAGDPGSIPGLGQLP